MKKIAFVGAGCTGKTTIFEGLQELYSPPDVLFAPEAARAFFAEHDVPDHERRSSRIQIMLMRAIQNNEQAMADQQPRLLVCDRSVLDAVAYIRAHGEVTAAEDIYQTIEPWISTYDHLYIPNPADVPYQPDAVRIENEQTRTHLHDTFVRFFAEHHITYKLLSGTHEERLAGVRADIVGLLA